MPGLMKGWQKILVSTHCIGLILCVVLLVGFRYEDHLRWGVGYMIVWFTTLSAFAIFFVRTGKECLDTLAKVYGLGWLAVVILLTLASFIGTIGVEDVYFPHKKYYEDDRYVIRRGYQNWIDLPNCALWIKDGVLERYDRKFVCFLTVDSCKVLSDWGAIVLYGETFRLEDDDLGRMVDIRPLDDKVFDSHRREIDSLKAEVSKAYYDGMSGKQANE